MSDDVLGYFAGLQVPAALGVSLDVQVGGEQVDVTGGTADAVRGEQRRP